MINKILVVRREITTNIRGSLPDVFQVESAKAAETRVRRIGVIVERLRG